jgi:hypothetical protein
MKMCIELVISKNLKTTLTHKVSMKETITHFPMETHYEHQICGCWQYSTEVLRK